MPKVSIIIPAYNAAKHIKSTIDSVLAQTYSDFELVVVDDGSTDETVEILRSYGDRIRWTQAHHKGQASAVNMGISISKGEYLAYLDADDLLPPNKLAVQIEYFEKNPNVEFVYSDMYYTTPQLGTILIKSQPIDPFRLLQRCYISRITVIHKRSCVDKVGLFDAMLTGSDDWDMWVRMSEKCRMGYVPQPLAEYRIHGQNTSHTRKRPLNHYRWSRMNILQRACLRRGNPFWLRIMLFNAIIQYQVGRIPWFGEFSGYFWAGVDHVQFFFERLFLRRLANNSLCRY